MSNRDFSIGELQFKLNKLDAFKQFHIVRRLGPILGDLVPAAKNLKGFDDKGLSEDQKLERMAEFIAPVMNGISKLSDKDADFVLMGLLSSVEIHQQTGNWARVSNGELLMIQTMSLPVMLQVAGRAFLYNLSDFFGSAHQVSHGGK